MSQPIQPSLEAHFQEHVYANYQPDTGRKKNNKLSRRLSKWDSCKVQKNTGCLPPVASPAG